MTCSLKLDGDPPVARFATRCFPLRPIILKRQLIFLLLSQQTPYLSPYLLPYLTLHFQ